MQSFKPIDLTTARESLTDLRVKILRNKSMLILHHNFATLRDADS